MQPSIINYIYSYIAIELLLNALHTTMRKSTRSFAFLLCIALFVCMLGSTAFADKDHKPQEPWDLAAAEKVYNRTTTFNHVDIRVNGTDRKSVV